MDYRRFLGKTEELVLPYLGTGDTVMAEGRALRLTSRPAAGWWRVRVEGRKATPVERAEPAFGKTPRVQGHIVGTRLVHERAACERLHLLPQETGGDEPAILQPCRARRWHDGALLFEDLPFEVGVEDHCRRSVEEDQGIAWVKGVPATLRAAVGYALAFRAARARGIPLSPLEVRAKVAAIAEGGAAVIAAELDRITAERRRAELSRNLEGIARRARMLTPSASLETRLEDSLRAAGARLRAHRALDGGLVEVGWLFEGERLTSVVDAATLQVIDSGVCLAGADRELTLDSLPGVIREAIETGALVVTRHDDEA